MQVEEERKKEFNKEETHGDKGTREERQVDARKEEKLVEVEKDEEENAELDLLFLHGG